MNQTQDTQTTLPAVRTGCALPARTMGELAQAGQLLAQSGMFGVNSPAAGFVVAATCFQQGISLMEFNRTYHIVEGRPSMRADAMLAEFRKRGGKYRIVENGTERAEADFEFEGVAYKGVYTMDDARRTGDAFKGDGKTLKHNWAKRPEDMLWARMVSRSVRRLCPEIVAGIYTPEETEDFDDRQAPRAAPVAIDPAEAARRVVAETVPPPPFDAPFANEPAEIDFSVCPAGFGEYSGKLWSEFDADTLRAAAAAEGMDSGLLPGHVAEIRKVLKLMEEGGAA
jgi:hypothetical protein